MKKYRQFNVRADEEILQRMIGRARQKNMPTSQYIREVIEEDIKNAESKEFAGLL